MKNIIRWWNKQSTIDKIIAVVGIISITYMVICWANIICHNMIPGYQYPAWNIFYTLFK